MICPDCREAGNYIVAVDLSYDFIDDGDVEHAEELHAKCKGGTWCDCAHVIIAPENRRGNLCKRRPASANSHSKWTTLDSHCPSYAL